MQQAHDPSQGRLQEFYLALLADVHVHRDRSSYLGYRAGCERSA